MYGSVSAAAVAVASAASLAAAAAASLAAAAAASLAEDVDGRVVGRYVFGRCFDLEAVLLHSV